MSENFRIDSRETFQWRGEQQVPPEALPQPVTKRYADFSKGYDSSQALENTPEGASPYMVDMELSKQHRLIRAPGTTLIETLARTPKAAVLHPGFAFASELVLLDPPFVGVKYLGATTWTDEGIALGEHVFANYAGVLLFSSGAGSMYARQPAGGISVVPDAPPAKSIAVFAGRVILGGTYTTGGPFDPMLLGWSGAAGDYTDWDTVNGAGFEALISDMQYADRIVALRPLGFDFLAILNRRSIWIAQRTGDPFRPIDPQPRIERIGCISERTAFSTHQGVIFLAEDGVRLFGGNDAPIISEPINNELLALTETQLGECHAAYNPATQRYYLFAPNATWVLDVNRLRWFRWSSVFDRAAVFPTQTGAPSWDDAEGTWDQQVGSWDSDLGTESGMPIYLFSGLSFMRENYAETSALGVALRPRWDGKPEVADTLDLLMRTDQVTLMHDGDGIVTVALPAFDGEYIDVRTMAITAPGPSVIALNHTGRGMGLGLRYEEGTNPKVRQASVRAYVSGQSR